MGTTGLDKDNSETKEKAIAEINRLITAWRPQYCRYLLKEANRVHEERTDET